MGVPAGFTLLPSPLVPAPTISSHPMRRRLIAILLPALVLAGVAWRLWPRAGDSGRPPAQTQAPASQPSAVPLAGVTMGGTWSVKIGRLPPGASTGAVTAAVQDVLDRVEGQMSTYRPASDLSRFNQFRGTDWFPVRADVAAVAAEARRVGEQTGGAFDVTVGPLVNLWGFGPPERRAGPFGTIPSDAAVAEARRHVGYRLLDVRTEEPPALRKADPEAYVDLSGIAKGYAADLVARRLDELGAEHYLVDVGGELKARGLSPAGRPWRVGIEVPSPDARRVLCKVELADVAVATSGDYRNYFDAPDGRRYSHEIDPRTGRPAANAPAAVSVVHTSGAYADAMATALMVLGVDEGYALAERLGLAVQFVTRGDGRFETRAAPGFEKMIVGGQ